jgi:hypothetical protein
MTSEVGGSAPSNGPQSPDEVARLRAENEALRAELEGSPPRRHRVRRIVAPVLAFLSALLLVTGVLAQWTRATVINEDKFVARVGPAIDQPQVKAEVATELSNEIISVLNLNQRINAALPPNLKFLSGPIAAGGERLVTKTVTDVVNSPAFTTVWLGSLRLTHKVMVSALSGSNQHYTVINGKVYIDLISVVDKILAGVQSQLPTIFGVSLSQVVPSTLPTDKIRSLLQQYLGVTLPPNFGKFPVFDASTLKAASRAYRILNFSPLLILLAALVAFVCGLWVSVRRRRTLAQFGLLVALFTAVYSFGLRQIKDATLAGISDANVRGAAAAALEVLFSTLREFATLLFWVGLIIAIVCYLIGPGRFPRWLRERAAVGWSWVRERTVAVVSSEGLAPWVASHLDPLRIAGVVVAAIVLFIWSSWAGLLVIAVLLGLYEVGVTLLARPLSVGGREAPTS